jgi:phosphonate transport system substrate-binding protein
MRKMIFFGALCLAAILMNGCSQENNQKNKQSGSAADKQSGPRLGDLVSTDTLILGIVPAEDPSIAMERQKPLTEYLSRELGRPIETFFATDYTGVVEAMRAGKVHIAWYGPFSYVMAAERSNAVPLAVAMHDDGSTTYQSYIVSVPKVAEALNITEPLEGDEGAREFFRRLEPHKGEFSFTFTDPGSTSGFAVPRYTIHTATDGGTPEEWFSRVGFVGSHDAGQLVVRNEIIDIAACWDKRYHELIAKGTTSPETNVLLLKSPPIPESPIAYRRDLPDEIVANLQRAFREMPESVVRTQGDTYKGYKIVTEKDYEVVVNIKKMLDEL